MADLNARGGSTDRVVDALVAVLPAATEIRADSGDGVVVAEQHVQAVWAGKGSLGDVRELLAIDRPDVVVAAHLSPGAREELRRAGVGWVDETGAAEIAIGTIIVSRTGHPPKKIAKPPRWTPGVLAVTEALLCGTRATVAEAEKATGLSAGSCTKALRALIDLGLLEASAARGRGSARRVQDRRTLLIAYAEASAALRPTVSLQVGVTWRDPIDDLIKLGRRWDEGNLSWATTGAVAAGVLAPYLGAVTTAEVYVAAKTIAELDAAARNVELRPIEGGRLTLRPFPTVTIDRLATTVDGLRVAPWPRVYADLVGVGVRGEEAAEHLWEVVNDR